MATLRPRRLRMLAASAANLRAGQGKRVMRHACLLRGGQRREGAGNCSLPTSSPNLTSTASLQSSSPWVFVDRIVGEEERLGDVSTRTGLHIRFRKPRASEAAVCTTKQATGRGWVASASSQQESQRRRLKNQRQKQGLCARAATR